MSTVSDTIITSALVSGGVTMAIEYAAKPRLEARKARILGYHEARRTFAANVMKLTVVSGTWANFEIPTHAYPAARQIANSERARSFKQIDDITADMVDNWGAFASTFAGIKLPGLHTNVPQVVSRYVYTVRGLALSTRSLQEKAQAIAELSEPFLIWFFGAMWQVPQRLKAMQQLFDKLDDYSDKGNKENKETGLEGTDD